MSKRRSFAVLATVVAGMLLAGTEAEAQRPAPPNTIGFGIKAWF